MGWSSPKAKSGLRQKVQRAIGRYDPAVGKVDWIMGTGQDRTHMLYVFPDAKRIVTTNVSSATVTILDKTEGSAGMPSGMAPPSGGLGPGGPSSGPPPRPRGGDWTETLIPVGRGSEGFDVSPEGKESWVANAWDGTISVIDLTAKNVLVTLSTNATGANRLKFTPDGKFVLVTAGSALVVLDSATRKEVKRLTAVHGSGGIQMQPDGARAYVVCGCDGYVAVIDLKTLTMAGRVDVGEPDGLAWAVQPQGQFLDTGSDLNKSCGPFGSDGQHAGRSDRRLPNRPASVVTVLFLYLAQITRK